MLEAKQVVCLLLIVSIFQTNYLYAAHNRKSRGNKAIDIKEKIIEVQCYAKCFSPIIDNRQDCERNCRIEMTKVPRPGTCPQFIYSNHISVCIDVCQYDFDCSETQKCCTGPCGSPVCRNAVGLDVDTSLPPIPKIVDFKVPRGHRACEVIIQSFANYVCVYHVEVRYHVGTSFSPRKLGSWQWQASKKIAEISVNKSKRIGISFKLKPGRWYQFRVAAINVNGFRGYTQPSEAFTLTNHPKPPKTPLDLKVISSRTLPNNQFAIRVAWCPAKSDLPVEKYRLSWALYVPLGADSLIENDTFIKDATQYEITGLNRNSSYYIQVQAISIIGKRRLKSEKASELFNTTLPLIQNGKLKCSNRRSSKEHIISATSDMMEDYAVKSFRNSSNYDVKFRLNKKFGMIAQVSGFHMPKGRVIVICEENQDCRNEFGAIRPNDVIDFIDLKFDTTYTIRTVDPTNTLKEPEFEVSSPTAKFTTPKCENWRKRFSKFPVKCEQ